MYLLTKTVIHKKCPYYLWCCASNVSHDTVTNEVSGVRLCFNDVKTTVTWHHRIYLETKTVMWYYVVIKWSNFAQYDIRRSISLLLQHDVAKRKSWSVFYKHRRWKKLVFFIIMFCPKYLPNALLLGLYYPRLFNIIRILTRTLRTTETCDATGVLLVRDGVTRVGRGGEVTSGELKSHELTGLNLTLPIITIDLSLCILLEIWDYI